MTIAVKEMVESIAAIIANSPGPSRCPPEHGIRYCRRPNAELKASTYVGRLGILAYNSAAS